MQLSWLSWLSHWNIRSVMIQALHSLHWKWYAILFITYRSISIPSTDSDKWYSLCLSLQDPNIWWGLFPSWSKEVPLDSHIDHGCSTARWVTTVLCNYTNLKPRVQINYWITLFPILHGLQLKIITVVLLILGLQQKAYTVFSLIEAPGPKTSVRGGLYFSKKCTEFQNKHDK